MDPSVSQRAYLRPDKRNAAFESIFGRPTALHHQPGAPPQQFPPYYQQPSTSSLQPSRQSYPQNGSPQSHHSRSPNPGYQLPPSAYPPSSIRYSGGDVRSHYNEPGVIAPLPQTENPVDGSLEAALQRTGLTPAQAYQKQIYMNGYDERNNRRQDSVTARSDSRQFYNDPNVARRGSTDGRLSTESARPMDPMVEEVGRISPYMNQGFQNRNSAGSSFSRTYPGILNTSLEMSSPSSTSSTMLDYAASGISNARRSTDSVRTVPYPSTVPRRERSAQDRTRSMSAAGERGSSLVDLAVSPTSITKRRAPIVYPALLSRVAEAFRSRVVLSERVKDGLAYTDAFDGREAVDKIAYIIKTTDRNLALLLGRALDAQKFFHDVTYDRRLRDSQSEIYQFRNRLPTPFSSGEIGPESSAFPSRPLLTAPDSGDSIERDNSPATPSETLDHSSASHPSRHTRDSPTTTPYSEDDSLPTGVFTLLTDCYSPTCSRERLCYSIVCPRRLEQQAHLNMKPQQVLKKTMSQESLGDVDLVEPGTLWIHSVSKEIADTVNDTEKKRQEAINEVIYTERDFVRDMEYLRDIWMKPLQTSNIVAEPRRSDFLEQVFWNVRDIIAVNTRLRDALNKRQRSYAIVERIGDILLDAVPHFEPFVSYGSHQLYGKYEFEKEKSNNPAFAQFVEETERRPESRKLELNGYLTKPTTRLARYPLLLEQVAKYTPDDNSDKVALPRVIKMIREFLEKVNRESGKAENRFNLWQLDQQLVFKPTEAVDLRLRDEAREIVYKGNLNTRGGSQNENGDVLVFLFDHALLMVKQKAKYDFYKVYRRPIPIELLSVYSDEEGTSRLGSTSRPNRTLARRNSFTKASASTPNLTPVVPPKSLESKSGFPMTFVYLGRHSYQITLYASTWVGRKKWLEHITKQQELMNERSSIFEPLPLSEGFFASSNKVNCAAPFHGCRRLAYGTDDGVYFTDLVENHREPVKVLAILGVTQLDVLEQYQLLIVLADKQVLTFPLDALDPRDTLAGLKRAKHVASHTSFFKAGLCLGRPLVSLVKSTPLSTTIKVLEPIDQNVQGRNKPTFRKLLQGGHDTLKIFKEFYIPVESNSIHFLKTKMCVGCVKGFEIVDLDTLETQGLLDPADSSLDFVNRGENVKHVKPMAIYRIENEFLLCYDEFAFYVNKSGWRARKNFMVHWEGNPTAFALHYPYVLAFEPSFVEIRHAETGLLAQILRGHNLRCLFADTPPSTTNFPVASYSQQNPLGHSPSGHTIFNQHRAIHHYGQSRGYARDEIIMVSDDKVMVLRIAGLGANAQSDSWSIVSIPRR